MTALLVWLVLLIVAWPVALLVLIVYPIVWLLALPFRLVGISVKAVFELLGGLISMPGRMLRR